MDKYISEAEKLLDKDSRKLVLSNDAYAIAEMIEELIKKIEHTRMSLI